MTDKTLPSAEVLNNIAYWQAWKQEARNELQHVETALGDCGDDEKAEQDNLKQKKGYLLELLDYIDYRMYKLDQAEEKVDG